MESSSQFMEASTDNFYPALFECFMIILCGYLAGRFNIVSQTESKGLATFVGTFALPSLIFLSLAELDFGVVNWLFLAAILISKGVVFFAVLLTTIFIGKLSNLGRAGLFAIFCTQSNDFAIGYPIIKAVYEKSHPEYASYLYLMAPISLALLNPIAFVLMEIGKQRSDQITDSPELLPKSCFSKLKMISRIIKGIALNPILLMTVLGIIGNLIFKHDLPLYIKGLLQVMGSAFSASALFLLGLRMVGQFHRLKGPALMLPAVLIIVKLVVLPVVMRATVSQLHSADSNDTDSLSTFAFLYGTVPTAPAVFVFSHQYQLELDLVASSMVLCTFMSAPLMFVSARMIFITKDYASQLATVRFDLSIVATVASVWVLLVFALTRKYKRMPHRVTVCLAITQLLLTVSVIWGHLMSEDAPQWLQVTQSSVRLFSLCSCPLWTTMLAIALLLLQSHGPCFIGRVWPILCAIAWGAPATAVIVLLLTAGHAASQDMLQEAVRACMLIAALIGTCISLVVYLRFRKRNARYHSLSADVAGGAGGSGEAGGDRGSEDLPCTVNLQSDQNQFLISPGAGFTDTSTLSARAIEELGTENSINGVACGELASNNCCSSNHSPTQECAYLDTLDRAADTVGLLPPEQTRGHGGQLLKHTVLIIAYAASAFVSIGFSCWFLMMDQMTGIYVELNFLDIMLTYGQSLAVWALFALDPVEVWLPLAKACKKIFYGSAAETVTLLPLNELSPETRLICEQFVHHHLERCRQDIAKDARWRMRLYRGVFCGTALVDWLQGCGLAGDAQAAERYARHLLDGRILAHVRNQHHFHNSPLLYYFV